MGGIDLGTACEISWSSRKLGNFVARTRRGIPVARGKGYTLIIETVPDNGAMLAGIEVILRNRALREAQSSNTEDEKLEKEETEV